MRSRTATFAGATRACVYGRRQGIEVIHGAEISCIDSARGRKVHILCYLCQNPDRLEGVFKRTKERRQRAAALMLQKVMRQYPITPDMVSRRAQGSTNIYKQHIMHALLDAGYTNEIFGDLFRSLFHPREGSAYAPVEYPEVTEIVPKIHEAGGLAVLAHPAVYDSYDVMEELLPLGLDGVEVWHQGISDDQAFVRICQNMADMTGGTDFLPGCSEKPNPLGTCTTGDDQVELMKKRCEGDRKQPPRADKR